MFQQNLKTPRAARTPLTGICRGAKARLHEPVSSGTGTAKRTGGIKPWMALTPPDI